MNTQKQAHPDHPIHELIARRWSPYAFADRPVTGMAIGYAADPNTLPKKYRQRELAPRSRKPLTEFIFGEEWGTASTIIK